MISDDMGALIIIGVFFGILLLSLFFRGLYERRIESRSLKKPLVSTPCKIVDKRMESSGGGSTSITNNYFLTLEFEDGSRRVMAVDSYEYGLLVVGDNANHCKQGDLQWVQRVKIERNFINN